MSTWVAVGKNYNKIAYSYDGIGWTGSTSGNNLFTSGGWCVASNGTSRWVAGGEGANTLAYSSDGIGWTGLGKTIFTSQCRCVAWNGTIWVAGGVGLNSIAYSSDGIGWTGSTGGNNLFTAGPCLGVAWNGTMWVAGGQGQPNLVYSYDGINWSLSNNSILTNTHCVASNASLDGVINIPNGSIVLNQYGSGLSSELDVVCDSYYNTGFTNCSISINSTSSIN
jgi:hypothetical protein